MDTTTAALITLGILVLFAVAYFAVFRRKGKAKLKAPFGISLEVEGSNEPSAQPGVRVKDAQAGGNIHAQDSSGHGVDAEKLKARGDIDLSSSSPGGAPPPKA